MEWNTSKEVIEKNLKDGEVMYMALGVYVAINPNAKKETKKAKP